MMDTGNLPLPTGLTMMPGTWARDACVLSDWDLQSFHAGVMTLFLASLPDL